MRRLTWFVAVPVLVASVLPAGARDCATMGATELVAGVHYCVDSVLGSQSGNDYGPRNLFDGDRRAAWCEGAAGSGAGQSIVLTVSGGTPFDRLLIWNGYQKSGTSFARNARPRTIIVSTDKDRDIRYRLPDTAGETVVRLKKMAERARVTITIADVYPGTRYQDMCISGLYLDFESGRDFVPEPPLPDGGSAAGQETPPSDGAEPPTGQLHDIAPLPDLPGLDD